jgi:hypothetical protein
MIGLQEELDWASYRAYGLTADGLIYYGAAAPGIRLGERAFEIAMARRMATGELETKWFERHGSTPITSLPDHWPAGYRALVERRIALIESDRNVGLIEQPEYKRRWNIEPFADRLKRHQRVWLCDRLEAPDYWRAIGVTSTAKLANHAGGDAEFMRVAEAYTSDPEFNIAVLVDELVRDEAMPFLPVLRYRESGLRKREQWERIWDLQRQEDAGVNVGSIPVPPKYTSADFQTGSEWHLRGKLDVPKERFVSYFGCERAADGSLPIAWAGWDHAQQARALGAYYMQIKNEEGTVPHKLVPLLAGLVELLPWVRQWHGGTDPEFGVDLGDSYADFVDAEARSLGMTVNQVRAWKPTAKRKKGSRKKS